MSQLTFHRWHKETRLNLNTLARSALSSSTMDPMKLWKSAGMRTLSMLKLLNLVLWMLTSPKFSWIFLLFSYFSIAIHNKLVTIFLVFLYLYLLFLYLHHYKQTLHNSRPVGSFLVRETSNKRLVKDIFTSTLYIRLPNAIYCILKLHSFITILDGSLWILAQKLLENTTV